MLENPSFSVVVNAVLNGEKAHQIPTFEAHGLLSTPWLVPSPDARLASPSTPLTEPTPDKPQEPNKPENPKAENPKKAGLSGTPAPRAEWFWAQRV